MMQKIVDLGMNKAGNEEEPAACTDENNSLDIHQNLTILSVATAKAEIYTKAQ
jgi:hypothetical protein